MYEIGDVVQLTAEFSQDSVDIDPTAVTLDILSPSGVTTSYDYGASAIERTVSGENDEIIIYSFNLSITEAGVYYYRWSSTGTGQAVSEASFSVDGSRFS